MRFTRHLTCLACWIFILFNLFIPLYAQNHKWAKGIATGTQGWARDVAIDADGNVIVVGGYMGTADLDPGPGVFQVTSQTQYLTAFIQKLDSTGAFLWGGSLQGTDYNQADAVLTDAAGNIYVVGRMYDWLDCDLGPGTDSVRAGNGGPTFGTFIICINAAGNHQWARLVIGAEINGKPVVDSAFNIYMGGHFIQGADFDTGPGIYSPSVEGGMEGFFARYDSNGNLGTVYQLRTMNLFSNSEIYAVDMDSAGFYVSGFIGDSVDLDPGSGVAIFANIMGLEDMYVCRYTLAGDLVWAKLFEANEGVHPLALRTASNGDVVVAGVYYSAVDLDPGPTTHMSYIYGNGDLFVLRLDPNGNFVWAKEMGGPDEETIPSMTLDDNGNIYLAAGFRGTVDFDPGPGIRIFNSAGQTDIAVQKLNAAGGLVWARQIGAGSGDEPCQLQLDADGNIYGVGKYDATVDFDPSPAGIATLTCASTHDPYVFKWDGANMIIGMEDAFSAGVEIYPNPTTGILWLKSTMPMENISVVNMMGQVVWEQGGLQENEVKVDAGQWTKGVYLLQVDGKARRVVVE
jgi:hypothetical protein